MKRQTLQLLVDALDGPSRELAIAVLRAEVGTIVAVPVEAMSRPRSEKASTVRWRRWQDKKKGVGSSVGGALESVGSNASNALANASLSLPESEKSPEKQEKDPEKREESAREPNALANAFTNGPSNAPTPTLPTNATGDAAFGMLVTAWADGIRSVTGASFPPPRGRAGGQLSELLRGVCAGAADACAAARAAGADYARANAGRTLSPFNFGDWLGSGKPDRASGVVVARPVQPTGAGGKRLWTVGGGAT